MIKNLFKLILVTMSLSSAISPRSSDEFHINFPKIVLRNIPFKVEFEVPDQYIHESLVYRVEKNIDTVLVKNKFFSVENLIFSKTGKNILEITAKDFYKRYSIRVIPGFIAIVPPLVAILFALLVREMIVALFIGIFIGVTIIYDYNVFKGFLYTLSEYLVETVTNQEHATIILFTLLFGGMIGVISKNGGMNGIAMSVSKYANSRRKAQLATLLLGLFIFFDDYSNTLIVGNTMRPFTDKMKISREKLAYIVDSTAAPVACLAFISTWSVFQMSLLEIPFEIYGINRSPYIVFLKSIPFNLYCLFAIYVVFLLIISKRDFGPMYDAEVRAYKENKLLRDDAQPLMDDSKFYANKIKRKEGKWIDGAIPILVVIIATVISLYFTGLSNLNGKLKNIINIIGSSDAYSSLLWASTVGGITAIILSLFRKLLTLRVAIEGWLLGLRSMLLGVIILVLAWTIGRICLDLKTADYIINITKNIMKPWLLPFVTFTSAALVSFSTGTSWGTMSILVPLISPLALRYTDGNPDSIIFLSSFAAILSGATFGDHCSPISDTTILSSVASSSDHIDHVRTQLPYAITVAIFSGILGYTLLGLGLNYFIIIFIISMILILAVFLIGKEIDN